jgi:hypothetical protein
MFTVSNYLIYRPKDDALLYVLARFTPSLTTLSIIDAHHGFSPMGLITLIEHCPHLSYIYLQTSPWTIKELSEFINLFTKSKLDDEVLASRKEFKGVWMMRGGLCLQYVSLNLAFELSVEEKNKLFVVAKKRFPILKQLEIN